MEINGVQCFLSTFFKISIFCVLKKKLIWVWHDMRISKWWKNSHVFRSVCVWSWWVLCAAVSVWEWICSAELQAWAVEHRCDVCIHNTHTLISEHSCSAASSVLCITNKSQQTLSSASDRVWVFVCYSCRSEWVFVLWMDTQPVDINSGSVYRGKTLCVCVCPSQALFVLLQHHLHCVCVCVCVVSHAAETFRFCMLILWKRWSCVFCWWLCCLCVCLIHQLINS